MRDYGCFLLCEAFGPKDLIEQARAAEQAGFLSLPVETPVTCPTLRIHPALVSANPRGFFDFHRAKVLPWLLRNRR